MRNKELERYIINITRIIVVRPNFIFNQVIINEITKLIIKAYKIK